MLGHPLRVVIIGSQLILTLVLASCAGGHSNPVGAPSGMPAASSATGPEGIATPAQVYKPSPTPTATVSWLPSDAPEPIPEGIGYDLPYPVPATCAVTPFEGPYVWRGFPAYWFVGDGLRGGTSVGVFFAGDRGNKVMLQADERVPIGSFAFTGERLDGPAPAPVLDVMYMAGEAEYVSGISFPEPGCWRIHLEAGNDDAAPLKTLGATVYVYRWSCYPTEHAATPEAGERCEAPGV